jgi:glycosyltransferase involved in cell wall biosynthesis
MPTPAITVAIPTYNWSSALRCAIRSVLLQTVQDFEVLVVGDGCTDDTAAVVASFGDPRVRFHNLVRNHGSQWAANNFANEAATADWIAYLGHDDIWYPTHLEAALRTAQQRAANVVAGMMVLYGPEGSGIRSLAGLFASGSFGSRDFVPPSAVAHARSVHQAGARWRDPDTIALPTDITFMREAAARDAIVPTGELTCFKFNASWRRDSYKVKPVDDQERMLRRIESGVDFRQQEYRDVLRASISGKFIPMEAPLGTDLPPGVVARRYRIWKGAERRYDASDLRRIEGRVRFGLERQDMAFEWHDLETSPAHGPFRWTGPGSVSAIDLPVIFDRDLVVRIQVMMALADIEKVKLSLHGQSIAHETHPRDDGSYLLQARLDHASLAKLDRDFAITLHAEPKRPFDLGPSEDRRWLGLAVNWCELEPA